MKNVEELTVETEKKRAREQVVRVFQADREFEVDVGPKQLQ